MASETPTPAPSETTRSKERREIPDFSRQDALQARLANPGENYSFINPANREVPPLTAEVISPKASDALIQLRSNEERQRTATGTVDAWKTAMVTKFGSNETKKFFQESEKGKRFAQAFSDTLGINVTQLTAENVTSLYDQFCATGDGKNGAIAFTDKIIDSYKNKSLKELEDNLDAFKWMGNILGSETSEILVQRISMMKRTENDEDKNAFVQAAAADNRINKPTTTEARSLTFLYGDGKNLPARPTATVTTPLPDRPSPEPPANNPPPAEPDKPAPEPEVADEAYLNEKLIDPDIKNPNHDLAEILKKLRYKNVDPARIGNWYVPNPPTDLGTLRDDELRGVIPPTQQTFFVPGTYRTNDEAIPHVWDLMVPLKDKKDDGLDTKYPNDAVNRFTEAANRLTEDDSSLIALSSVASSDENKQAQVYADIARVLVETFRRNDIWKDWLVAQNHDKGDAPSNSLRYYMLQDDKWADDFDDNYRALPQSPDGKLDVSSTAWNARLNELDEAIKQKKYNLYHHRWLETMSKAVDMRRVMNLIKTKQAPVAA